MSMLRWVALAIGVVGMAMVVAMWPRDDTPRDPDAIVVLGGAGRERTELGIELRERFRVPLVLSSSAIVFGHELGLECREDVICLEPDPETTAGEARSIAVLADERGWSHVTVATSRFHSTRARVLFRQCLGDRVTVIGAPQRDDQVITLRRRLNEILGTIAAWTFARAC
jgi:uncharacterized SAM-binding protein YcdF (DUF218 family)